MYAHDHPPPEPPRCRKGRGVLLSHARGRRRQRHDEIICKPGSHARIRSNTRALRIAQGAGLERHTERAYPAQLVPRGVTCGGIGRGRGPPRFLGPFSEQMSAEPGDGGLAGAPTCAGVGGGVMLRSARSWAAGSGSGVEGNALIALAQAKLGALPKTRVEVCSLSRASASRGAFAGLGEEGKHCVGRGWVTSARSSREGAHSGRALSRPHLLRLALARCLRSTPEGKLSAMLRLLSPALHAATCAYK